MKAAPMESLKADLPQSRWGKILGATPVVLTVVATLLAGLSSSEMTGAQYDRSLAAQLQSKAGDQWSFFQAKRLRSALQQNTLDVISNASPVRPLDLAALQAVLAKTGQTTSSEVERALTVLNERTLPKIVPPTEPTPAIREALAALESARPDAEFVELLGRVSTEDLDRALRVARENALALDGALKPVTSTVESLERALDQAGGDDTLRRNFISARITYNARRYDAEARLNQAVASLYELQVRKSNLSAERHHRRSQKFFYGMLAAQTGVIISTLAIAAHKRNLLWSLGAAAGAAALAFAAYVYLYV